ncbi:MAG: acetate--CoA ligase family protein [Acidobacteria bacterium]|nr:acetate--CoA ligase family protein [Acidobacteriota bacterium]
MTESASESPRVSRHALERLLHPRSIAIVGASDVPESIGGAPIALIERFGYDGEVHLVSRTRTHINERPCVNSIDDLPYGVDALVLAIPKIGVVDALEAAGRRGVGGAIVFSSGYAEADSEGAADQLDLAVLARKYDIALAGPNCLGLINFTHSVPLTFGDASPNRRFDGPSLAIIAQSGAMSLALTYAAMAQDIAVSYTISTGNEAVLGIEDYLGVILDQDGPRAVALLVEQIRRPTEFIELARVARERGIALCVLHTGRSERGQAASLSHTGAIAGDQALMRAVLGREGVLFIDSLDELIDTACVVVKCPAPSAYGVAFMTDSGAAKTHAIDVGDDIGLLLPELTAPTLRQLTEELPSYALASNPVDITAMGLNDPSLYGRVASTLLSDDQVGCLVVSAMPGSHVQGTQQVDALLPVLARADKPVIYTIMGGDSPLPPENIAKIFDAGLPLFRSPERALRAARNVTHLARTFNDAARRSVPGVYEALDIDPSRPMSEHEAKSLLSHAGLRVPDGGVANDVDAALEVAARIGYPVILKIASAQILHKSDVGGVIMVSDEQGLTRAYEQMLKRVRSSRPDASIEGVLVEEAVIGGVEMIVGARRDAAWGDTVLIGLGGVWAEVFNDAVVVSADADRAEILTAIESLRGSATLHGVRGGPMSDIDALVRAVELIAGLLRATPTSVEIEINPLVVLQAGDGVAALDAIIVTQASPG